MTAPIIINPGAPNALGSTPWGIDQNNSNMWGSWAGNFTLVRMLNFSGGGSTNCSLPNNWYTFPSGQCTRWACIECPSGTYTFTALNAAIANAVSLGQKVMMTAFETPDAYTCGQTGGKCAGVKNSVNPNNNCYLYNGGLCQIKALGHSSFGSSPPYDLPNSNGTGTDASYIAFVNALWTDIHSTFGNGVVTYFEAWNESQGGSWDGSKQQALRMMCDAFVTIHAIDSSVIIMNPPQSNASNSWLAGFLASSNVLPTGISSLSSLSCNSVGGCHAYQCMGAASNANPTVGTHTYVSGNSYNPDAITTAISNVRSLLTGNYAGFAALDTEMDWTLGQAPPMATCGSATPGTICQHTRSSYVARSLLLGLIGGPGLSGFNNIVVYDLGKGITPGPENYQASCAGGQGNINCGAIQMYDYWDSGSQTASCPAPGITTATYPGLNCAGIAWQWVYNQLTGATTLNCSPGPATLNFGITLPAGLTGCTLISSGAKNEFIVWNNTCYFNGSTSCTPSSFTPSASNGFTKYEMLWNTSFTSCGGTCTSAIAVDDRPVIISQ
jgi:hypothetical protein